MERAEIDEPLDEWPEPDLVRAHLDELVARAARGDRRDDDVDNPVVAAAPSVVDGDAETDEAVVDGEPVGSPFPRSRPFDRHNTRSAMGDMRRQPSPTVATAAVPAAATDRAIHRAASDVGDEMWRAPQRAGGAVSALEATLRDAFAASPGQPVAGADADADADAHSEPEQTIARSTTSAESGELDSAAPDSDPDVSAPYGGEMATEPVGRDPGDGWTAAAGLGGGVDATSELGTQMAAIEASAADTAAEQAERATVVTGGGWSSPALFASRSLEQWSVLALIAAGIGLIPFTWPVPILSLMAVAFGLVGMRNCQLDRMWRNRWMAVLAFGLGLATLVAALLLTSLGKLHFLPFWTTSPGS